MTYVAKTCDIYSWTITLEYFDTTKVNDEVEIGMSNLYYKVMPKPPEREDEVARHFPIYESISGSSYMYTSKYTYNKLDIYVLQEDEYKLTVRFCISPMHTPDVNSNTERNRIKLEVADFIHRRIQDHGDQLKEEAFEQIYDVYASDLC